MEEDVNKKCIYLLLELIVQVMQQNNYQPEINEQCMLSEITMHHLVFLNNHFGDDVIPICFKIINRLSSLDIRVKQTMLLLNNSRFLEHLLTHFEYQVTKSPQDFGSQLEQLIIFSWKVYLNDKTLQSSKSNQT